MKAMDIDEVKTETCKDSTLQKAISYVRSGSWYEMKTLNDDSICIEELTSLRSIRDELTIHSDNILLRDQRIVLPKSLRDRAVQIAHEGHQGITKTITIHHERPCRIEISHPRGRKFNQGRGLPSPWLNSDPEGEISLSYMDRLMMDRFSPTFRRVFVRT